MKSCPSCKKEIKARKNGKCPECGVKLELIEVKEGKFDKVKYAAPPPPPALEPVNRRYFNNTYVQLSETEWLVTFYLFPERIVCPKCRKLQFVALASLNGKLERKCDKCKTITTYIFEVLNVQGNQNRVSHHTDPHNK